MIGTGAEAAEGLDTLGAEIGALLGDAPVDDTPEPSSETEGAGAPPAESSPPEPSPDGGVQDAPPDGEPSERTAQADAAATPADDPATPDADPLAAATALTYTVNGESRTYDGIRVLGDEAIITREALPDVMRKLGERDHLYQTNQAQYRTIQHLESVGQWKTRDANGTEQTLSGAQGVAAMRVDHAKQAASLNVLMDAFKNPTSFLMVNDQGQVVHDPAAINALLLKSELAEIHAANATVAEIGTLTAPRATTQAPDFASAAPAVIQAAAGDRYAQLSDEAKTFLAESLPQYVRPATREELQANPKQAHILLPGFVKLVAREVKALDQAKSLATTSAAAAKQNTARLLAARGTKAPAVAPKKHVPTPADTSSDAVWNMMERAAAGSSRR